MAATPVVMARSNRIAGGTFNTLLPRTGDALDSFLNVSSTSAEKERPLLKDHLVIIGFGLNGRNVAWAAQSMKVRCVVVEEDPELAEQAVERGIHTVQGDATQTTILEKAHAATAKVVVVALSESQQTKRVVANVRRFTKAHMIVRSCFAGDAVAMYAKGANEVISEDFEGSLQVVDHVLRSYQTPTATIHEIGRHLRELQQSSVAAAKTG